MGIKNQKKNLSIPGKNLDKAKKKTSGSRKIHQKQGNLTKAQRRRSKYSSNYKTNTVTIRYAKIHSRELLDLSKLS
jgi:hypothetical protein